MPTINELQSLDYKILKFLNKNGKTKEDLVYKKLKTDKEITSLRIDLLSTPDYKNHIPLENTCYINKIYEDPPEHDSQSDPYSWDFLTPVYTGYIEITPFGRKSLEDFVVREHNERNRYYFRYVFVPYLISLITAYITARLTSK